MSIATTKNFIISGGSTPYTWAFSSDVPCATIEEPTGISVNGKINATIIYDTAECIAASTVTLTVNDANGCSSSHEVVVSDPCVGFTANDITKTGDWTLSCSGTVGGSLPPLQFVWSYDKSLFTISSTIETATTSQITLEPIAGKTIPSTTLVTVLVTNAAGCSQEKSFTLTICVPNAPSKAVIATCDNENSSNIEAVVDLSDVGANCSTEIDWTTLSIRVPDNRWYSWGFTYDTHVLTLDARDLTPSTYTLTYTMKNIYGVVSNTGRIFVTVPTCSRTAPIILPDPIRKSPAVSPGDIVDFRLDDKVISSKDLDWSTFTVLNTPASPSISVEASIAGGIYMKYEVPALNPDDIVTWTVSDVDGVQAVPNTIAVVTSDAAPVANNDTVGVIWGESTVKDVLANDTSTAPLDPNTVTITSQSQTGLTSVQSNGDVEVFGLNYGIDLFKYKVKDIYGNESNQANVAVQVFYAGTDSDTDLCASLPTGSTSITPYNYLTAPENVYINIGGTWTLTSSPGVSPAAPGTYNGSMTFTAGTHTVGDHVYTYSVTVYGVTATAELTISFQPYVAAINTSCAAASSLSLSGRNTSITHSGFTNRVTCPGQGPIPGSGVAVPTQWGAGTFNSDLWYSFIAPGDAANYPITITASGSAYTQADGIYSPAIAVYSGTCAGLTLVSANIASVTNQSISTSIVVNSATPVTYYVRIDCQNGYEGSYDITLSAS